MIKDDPQLETRLRHYGSVLRNDVRVSPRLHAGVIDRLEHQGVRSHRLIAQLAAAAAMILVAIGAVGLVLRVRAAELAKAAPTVSSVSPADGATGIPLAGQFRAVFATRPANMPVLKHVPDDGSQQPAQWEGSTLVVSYSGLHAKRRYEVVLAADYRSSFGGSGHFEKHWTFTTELGPPPAAGPLIWYATAPYAGPDVQSGAQIALDWNGAVVGMLREPGNLGQSPDGLRLLLAGVGYIDQAGTPVANGPAVKGGPGWADDSRQRCQMSTASGSVPTGLSSEPAWLYAGPIGSPLHRVVQAGEFSAQTGPSVAACSPLTDRAVVLQDAIMWAREVWVFRLSTGALLYHHVYGGQVASSIVASHDGRYLAESLISNDSQGHVVYGDTVIRRTSDGATPGRVSRQAVVGFSWDGARVITMPAYESGGPNEVRVVDWQRGQVLWRQQLPTIDPASPARVNYLARPGGSEVVIAIGRTSTDGTPDHYDGLWLVQADGKARQIVVGQLFPDF